MPMGDTVLPVMAVAALGFSAMAFLFCSRAGEVRKFRTEGG